MGNTMEERPPLGLMPRSIHDKARILEILAAMDRYIRADKAVPAKWFNELREIMKKDSGLISYQILPELTEEFLRDKFNKGAWFPYKGGTARVQRSATPLDKKDVYTDFDIVYVKSGVSDDFCQSRTIRVKHEKEKPSFHKPEIVGCQERTEDVLSVNAYTKKQDVFSKLYATPPGIFSKDWHVFEDHVCVDNDVQIDSHGHFTLGYFSAGRTVRILQFSG